MLGQLLDRRYKILSKLGEGAFGETYLAQDQKRPREPLCVVKRLKPGYTDRRVFELFDQEADVLERLGRHPQIPQLLAHFALEQEFFIAQEYIEGHSLRKEIRPGRRLGEDYTLRFLQEVLEILEFVHQNQVIHRDIKPENIMRRQDGRLVLIDFGAVKELGTVAVNPMGQIATSVIIGTMGYMPPEQAKGRPRLSSDLYAIGMIAIEALTGIHPLSLPEDPHSGEVMWRDQVPVTPDLADILDTMVRDRYTRRYPSATEALAALRHFAQLPSLLTPLPPPVPPKPALLPSLNGSTVRISMSILVPSVNYQGQETRRREEVVDFFTEDLGNGTILELVAIPGGKFDMGSLSDEALQDAESPQHPVIVSPFLIGMFPVTQAQWQMVAALPKVHNDLCPNPARFKSLDRPIERVSWYDAVEFCARLSHRYGCTYRLPTEAEWEYACRAGTTTPFYFGETITPHLANYNGNYTYGDAPKGVYRRETTPVGMFPPNRFGLHDMHGNVWEWCADSWHDNYQGAPSNGEAWIDDEQQRLLRGGAWNREPWMCRSTYRDRDYPTTRNKFIGFRIVCDACRPAG